MYSIRKKLELIKTLKVNRNTSKDKSDCGIITFHSQAKKLNKNKNFIRQLEIEDQTKTLGLTRSKTNYEIVVFNTGLYTNKK